MIKSKSFLNCINPQTYAIIVFCLFVLQKKVSNLSIRFARCCIFKEKTWVWLKRHFHIQTVSHRFMFLLWKLSFLNFKHRMPGLVANCLVACNRAPTSLNEGLLGGEGLPRGTPWQVHMGFIRSPTDFVLGHTLRLPSSSLIATAGKNLVFLCPPKLNKKYEDRGWRK